MDEQKYKIVFKGETVPGVDPDTVKQNLARFYNVDIQKAGALFSGKAFILKEGVDLDSAQKYMLQFEQMGAICMVEKRVTESPPAPPVSLPEEVDIKPEPAKPGIPLKKPSLDASGTRAKPGPYPSAYSFKKPSKKSMAPVFFLIIAIVLAAVVIFKFILKEEPVVTAPSKPQEVSTTRTPAAETPGYEENTRQTPGTGISSDRTEAYSDPNGNYVVTLPSGYTVAVNKIGNRNKVSITYGSKAFISIISGPLNRKWEPQAEMAAKMNGLQNGALGPEFSQFSIEKFGLVTLSGMEGYEIFLAKDNNRFAHHYAFLNSKSIVFDIVIVTMGLDSLDNNTILDSAIKGTFLAL